MPLAAPAGVGGLRAAHLGQEPIEPDLHHEPSKVETEAAVHPEAEPQMLLMRPAKIEFAGPLPAIWIAVGRAEQGQDQRAVRQHCSGYLGSAVANVAPADLG